MSAGECVPVSGYYEAEEWCRCILIHPSGEKNVSRRSGTFFDSFRVIIIYYAWLLLEEENSTSCME